MLIVLVGAAVGAVGLFATDDLPFFDLFANDKSLDELADDYGVVIMKHCYPSSNILRDTGNTDPTSERRSIENYKSVYRSLRAEFNKYPDTIFILWTLPPLHRLASEPDNAARATEFSEWMTTDFLTESGQTPNIYVWDFRKIVMDPETNFLKYEYEKEHENRDSHPNEAANNAAGPQFAQFIVDSIESFNSRAETTHSKKIVFLHHSTGRNVYNYPDQGIPEWINDYNETNKTKYKISEIWYPSTGNMPVHYYKSWLKS